MKANVLPTKKELDEVFIYNPEDGKLVWKTRPREHFKLNRIWLTFNTRFAGKEAGNKARRHLDNEPEAILVGATIGGKILNLAAHRIIFIIMGVDVPIGMVVDHRDGNPWNNKWSNLRLTVQLKNTYNRRSIPGRILPKGVIAWPDGRFRAQIKANKKFHHIGLYDTPEEASLAYREKSKELHGEFARIAA